MPRDDTEFANAVRAYRYVAPTPTLLQRAFLDAFWDWLVLRIPRSVAPNVLTLLGLGCFLAMYFVDWFASPDGLGTARPRWLYAVFALLLFVSQTVDGLDGKQARRTKSGSALGEMMDHGVDALTTGLGGLVCADAFGCGLDSVVTWLTAFGAQLAFFASNLVLVHRGSQKFFAIDILELQLGLTLCWLVSAIFGPAIWRDVLVPIPDALAPICTYLGREVFQLPVGPRPGVVEARFIMAIVGVGGTVANCLLYSLHAFHPYMSAKPPAHVLAGVPGTGLSRLVWQLVLLSAYGALAFAARGTFATIVDPSVRHDALRALLFGSCFAFGDLVNRLLLMRVARRSLPVVPSALYFMAAFALGARFAPNVAWWWWLAVACLVNHLVFSVRVSRKLARALGSPILRVSR